MRIKDIGTRSAPASIRGFLSRVVRGQGPAIAVQRREIPYWQERGWTRNGNVYTGSFATPYEAFFGHIEEHRGGHIDFFLSNPSHQIRGHSHWTCFQDRGNHWYLVHMSRQPRDVSSGILTIERLITDAYEV